MDPLSIAASIAGLLTLTGAIISKGYVVISAAKRQDADLKGLLDQVASFSGILHGFQSQYGGGDQDSEREFAAWFSNASNNTWLDTIEACKKALVEIQELIESRSKAGVAKLMITGTATAAKIEKLMLHIERFKSLFVLCLQFRTSTDIQTTARLSAEMLGIVRRMAANQDKLIQKVDAKEQAELQEKLVAWLRPNPEDIHHDIARGRHPDACQWLIDRTEFKDWHQSAKSSRFWLCGPSGFGKTVIVSKVIDAIEDELLMSGDIAVYHYCRFSDDPCLTSEKILGGFVTQLVTRLPQDIPLPSQLRKTFDKYRSRSYPNRNELENIFYELCAQFSRVFVIIDGLDEFADRRGLLHFLAQLEHVNGILKVFVTSRPDFDVEHLFEPCLTVAITAPDVHDDMQNYVRRKLKTLEVLDSEDLNKISIITQLIERSEGMFRWTVCQLDQLSRIRRSITADVLTALPRGLEETYFEVLSKLDDEDQALALEILRVVMFAERALEISELVEAVAISRNVHSLEDLQSNMLRRPNDMFELCGSLIQQSPTTKRISLSHYSVKEFLSLETFGKGRKNPFFLDKSTSNILLTERCIFYLCLADFKSKPFQQMLGSAVDPLPSDSQLPTLPSYSFLEYASNHWADHLRDLSQVDFAKVWKCIKPFFDGHDGSFQTWILISQYHHGGYRYPTGAKPIHVAALYGLGFMLTEILNFNPLSRITRTSDGRSALHIAIENEHWNVVVGLLESSHTGFISKHELLDIADKRGRQPLHVAIETGNAVAVRHLIDCGANLTAIQSDGRTPISMAIENNWDILADTLSQVADPSWRLEDGRSLLHLAAESGSRIWTNSLLNYHREKLIDTQDKNGWTPLHYAVDREHPEIVARLLLSRCLIQYYDHQGWTPLHAAIRRRNFECLSLLLKEPNTDELREKIGLPMSVAVYSRQISLAHPRTLARGDIGQGVPARLLEDSYVSESLRSRSLNEKYGRTVSESSPSRPASSVYDKPRVPETTTKSRQPSPLYLAVSESYTAGVALLSNFPAVLSKYGSNNADKVNCFLKALRSENQELVDLVKPMLPNSELDTLIFLLAKSSSRPVQKFLRRSFTTSEVYEKKIPLVWSRNAPRSYYEPLLPRVIQLWPEPEEEHVLKLVSEDPSRSKILCENGVAVSKVLLETTELPLLHLIIRQKPLNMELLVYFVSAGVNLEVTNSDGRTPLLSLAAMESPADVRSRLKLARLLVSKGANIHAVDRKSLGLCHCAAISGNTEFLDWAVHSLKLDASHRADASTPLFLATKAGHLETVRLFLKKPSNANEHEQRAYSEHIVDYMEYSNTSRAPIPFALMTVGKNASLARNLLAVLVKADEQAFHDLPTTRQAELINTREAFYAHALLLAISHGFTESFALLLPQLSRGTIETCTDDNGEGIFHLAAAHTSDEPLSVLLKLLDPLKNGDYAALSKVNARKQTPLDIIIEKGSKEKYNLMKLHSVKHTVTQLVNARLQGLVGVLG